MSTTAAAPATVRTGTPRLALVFTGLMMVLLLAALDSTIVATALPTIVGDLGGLERIAWVTSAFLLAQTVVTPLYGKLGDQLGRKRVLQSAVVLFLAGSALCGLSQTMTELIAFRAVQGLGAGGLIVLVQASVGDVVPPRERGRYQGLFGAVFGFAAVAGPLLGGVIVDNLSWRWIFYVNLPVGILALIVLSATLPDSGARSRPVIDYLGAGVLASALAAIVLVASLGGTTWPWGSPQTVVVAVAGVALLGVFIVVERHAREPVLPLSLLRDEVFRVASLLSLIVGFALFGTITFLPLFFQTVFHASPTGAGLRLIPLMGGLVTASVISGRRIAATGRYRRFPIFGTLLLTIGLFLLSRIGLGTSSVAIDAALLVVGLGLGLTMQVLVLAVQNAVGYELLGAATSGVTLTRGIGGSFGAAVFGTIFTTRLRSELRGVLHGPLAAQVAGGGRLTGAQVASLPHAAEVAYANAYVNALRPVFLVATGIGAVGFVLSLRLRERPLRTTAATSNGLEDSLAAPKSPSSLAEIDRALSVAAGEQRRREFSARMVARAGVDISPGAAWALARFSSYGVAGTLGMARSIGIPEERIGPVQAELRERGLVEGEAEQARLTPAGTAMADQLLSARREELRALLDGNDAERAPEVQQLIEQLCVELSGQRPDRAQASSS
ncbi:MAG TPA: DHA2 family efflux MFS transporter permease subunit [Solirubrobacteraceae bacterium]|jgi:EmrB/QacA subfamily drug resistance transporter|nr:DHA2 family efflux MFS transporter permease subunit [Solirubrobacteraceae bacterium]